MLNIKKIGLLSLVMSSMLGSLVQAKTTQPTVVEIYRSQVVWQGRKEVGFVWITDQGALSTWNDFMTSNNSDASYGFMAKDGTLTSVTFATSKAVQVYYSAQKWGQILPDSNTVYSYASVNGTFPQIFVANNLVPHFGVKSGEIVKRLSNGMYLYPNGREYRFNHWQMVTKSVVPASLANQFENFYASENQIARYFFRIPYKGTYEYTAEP